MKTRRSGFTVTVMIIATALSKLLGMARQIMLAKRLGDGVFAVSFSTASKIPLSVFDILLSAAIVACFVPFYSDKLTKNDDSARRFSSSFFTLTIIVSSVIAVLGSVFSNTILSVCAPSLSEEAFALGTKLLSVMFPMIIFTGAAYVLVGILQSHGNFILPSLVSSISNIAVIIYLAVARNIESEKAMLTLAAIYVLSWAIQFFTLAVPIISTHLFPALTIKLRGKGLAPALKAAPSVIAGAWLLPACSLLITFFASFVSDRAVAAFDYSVTLWLIASGVLTYGVCNFILPSLSRTFSVGDDKEFSHQLVGAVFAALALSLPVAIGLYFLSDNIICMIYMRGNFGAELALICGKILGSLAFSVPFFCVFEVLSRGFFARKRPFPVVVASISGITVFAAAGAVSIFILNAGEIAIAVSYGMAHFTSAMVLFIFAVIKIKGFFCKQLGISIGVVALSGGVCLAATALLHGFFEKNAVNSSIFQNFIVCAIVFSGGCVVYLICIGILRKIAKTRSKEV